MYRILYRFVASLARLIVRSGRSKDLEIIVLGHQLGVLRRQVDRPEFTDADRSLLGAIAAALPRPSRAGWLVTPDTLFALAPPPHRRALDSTTATAGPAIDLSEASPTRAAPRSGESNLAISPRPRRTCRARPPPRCVHGLADPQQRRNRPRPHTLRSHLVAVPRSQGAVACDFTTIETVTLHRFYLLLCIDIGTRTVYFAGVTDHPSGVWTTQAARNLLLQHGHQLADARALVRDRASQFIDAFDEIFRTKRMKILKTPVRTPVANAFAERWIATLRRELLDRTIIWNRRQLNKLVVDYIDHYNTHRPHRSLDQLPPVATDPPDQPDRHLQVVKTARCGGLINEYRNAA